VIPFCVSTAEPAQFSWAYKLKVSLAVKATAPVNVTLNVGVESVPYAALGLCLAIKGTMGFEVSTMYETFALEQGEEIPSRETVAYSE